MLYGENGAGILNGREKTSPWPDAFFVDGFDYICNHRINYTCK
jgi:hypothetical protein